MSYKQNELWQQWLVWISLCLCTMKLSSCSSHRWSSSICCCCIISLSSIRAWPLSCNNGSAERWVWAESATPSLRLVVYIVEAKRNLRSGLFLAQLIECVGCGPPGSGSTALCVQVCADSRSQPEGSCFRLLHHHRGLMTGGGQTETKRRWELVNNACRQTHRNSFWITRIKDHKI